MKKFELHTHTTISPCAWMSIRTLLKRLKKKGYDGTAITDHNTIANALKAKRIAKEFGLEIIIGEEVSTDHGHVLCYELNETIPRGRLVDVLDAVKEQDALAVIAHPYTPLPTNFTYDVGKIKHKIRGIEVFNSKIMFPSRNQKAELLTEKHNLARTAGSDSHFPFEVGRAATLIEDNLRYSLKKKKTKPLPQVKCLVSPGTLFSLFKKIAVRDLSR